MKRILSLALICVVLVISLAPAAGATVIDGYSSIDVLGYSMPNDGDSPFIAYNSGDVFFTLPYRAPLGYVDLIVVSTGSGLSGGTIRTGSHTFNLTCLSLGSNVYRLYGSMGMYAGDSIALTFTRTGTNDAYITFQKFTVNTSPFLGFADIGFFAIDDSYFNPSAYQYMPNVSTPIKYEFGSVGTTPVLYEYYSYFYCNNWKRYDFLEYHIKCHVSDIVSITAYQGNRSLAVSTSIFSQSAQDWYSYDNTGESGFQLGISDETVDLWIIVDLSNADRNLSTLPALEIRGNYWFNDSIRPFFQLYSFMGYVETSGGNPFTFYLSKILFEMKNGFSDVIAALSGDTSSGDAFKDDSAPLISGLDDISSSMDSLSKPSMDNLDTDFSGDMSGAGVLMGKLFDEVFSVNWSYTLIIASLTVGVVAYILYGKD